MDFERSGWKALTRARRRAGPESILYEVDSLLIRLLEKAARLGRAQSEAAVRIRVFRVAELERMQSAAAAALVAGRYGEAGLRAVVEDRSSPVIRRYFAFLGLAERHRARDWDLFENFLRPSRHYAFVGAAVEAVRFYPERRPASSLIRLFECVRGDVRAREFLGPRIMGSLYVLRDAKTLPFFRHLLVAGHTDPDPSHCEVMRAVVMVHIFTGRVEENSKFRSIRETENALDRAVRDYDMQRGTVHQVTVI